MATNGHPVTVQSDASGDGSSTSGSAASTPMAHAVPAPNGSVSQPPSMAGAGGAGPNDASATNAANANALWKQCGPSHEAKYPNCVEMRYVRTADVALRVRLRGTLRYCCLIIGV